MKNNLSTKNQLKNKQIKTLTNVLDNCGMDYPKRDESPFISFLINELKKLKEEDLNDVIMGVGGFCDRWVDKHEVENLLEVDLYYKEYKGTDVVKVFVFPNNEENE